MCAVPHSVPPELRRGPFTVAEAARLGFVQRLADPGTWPDLVRRTAEAQRLEPAAALRLKERVKPDMRAADMAALVDSAAAPGLKHRIHAFRSARSDTGS